MPAGQVAAVENGAESLRGHRLCRVSKGGQRKDEAAGIEEQRAQGMSTHEFAPRRHRCACRENAGGRGLATTDFSRLPVAMRRVRTTGGRLFLVGTSDDLRGSRLTLLISSNRTGTISTTPLLSLN
jgi:hypothetical protein